MRVDVKLWSDEKPTVSTTEYFAHMVCTYAYKFFLVTLPFEAASTFAVFFAPEYDFK